MSPGTHGANCTSSCLCQNQGNCHPVTGICHCPMGWTVSCVLSPLSLDSLESTLCDQGEVCANPCPTGTYHVDCKRRCDCYNGAVCDHVTGKCHCLPGFKGAKVGSVCDHCTGCCDPSLSIKSDDGSLSSARSSVHTGDTARAVSTTAAVTTGRAVTPWMAGELSSDL